MRIAHRSFAQNRFIADATDFRLMQLARKVFATERRSDHRHLSSAARAQHIHVDNIIIHIIHIIRR